MRLPQIQGLRALAVVLVLLYHAKFLPGGYIGVDIFYVISGYLITSLLLRECEKTDGISFARFYLRRIKRLLPASSLVLIITALVSWWVYPSILRADLGRDIAAASLYISNYFFALWQMDYQNLDAIPPVVIHYWSLAVEEQFYLLWPLIIYLLYKFGKRRTVGIGIAVITLISFLLSLFLTSASPLWAFYSLPTRAWELGIGALVLFFPAKWGDFQGYAWLAVIAIGYSAARFTDASAFPGTAALFPVLATAFTLASVKNWPKVIDTSSRLPVIQWLGNISYPLYLWHWPVLVIPNLYLGRELSIIERLIAIVLTLILADLTHRFVEQPLRVREFSQTRILAGATLITILTLILSIIIINSHNNQVTLKSGEQFSLESVLALPKIYQDGCHLENGQIIPPECTYGKRNAERKIVLFGDSHAAQWFPALEKMAKENGFALTSFTKSACPGPAIRKVNKGGYKNSDCSKWRDNVYKRIAELKPEAVLVSGMQYFQRPEGYQSRAQWWQEGQRKTLLALRGLTPKVIYIADTPHPKQDIPSCLSSKKARDCDNTEKTPLITVDGYLLVDPTPWLCARTCPAVLDGIVTYRDASHISVEMSTALSAQMARALRALGLDLG
ncbi:acyltransferase [Candidatus Planktophila versatilis]|uniref:Acyltransferase n=1 Tax=Candidatus Planktophila versatilis TaxID=1884905 RepID=A0AAC9YVX0_9ACTN|nr:acyltransferase family protein [Candidatus Planktophila versatilis]ASY22589.1 acyltransferase [Candidatus Planktophila versatilis]